LKLPIVKYVLPCIARRLAAISTLAAVFWIAAQAVEADITSVEIIEWGAAPESGAAREREPAAVPRDVVIYTAAWCPYCRQAKRYFEKEDIAYTEYDVERSERGIQDYERLGGGTLPIIFVGHKYMTGFSETGFRAFYERNLAAD